MKVRWIRLLAAAVVFGGSALWWRRAPHAPSQVSGDFSRAFAAAHGYHAALQATVLIGLAFTVLFVTWLLTPLFFPRRSR